jgi:diaminopimelate decarboxylase
MLPPLEAGDRVLIRPVGAYNVTQWMQFSQLRPAVVLVGQDKQAMLIRRAETIDDVKGPECLPDRYRLQS